MGGNWARLVKILKEKYLLIADEAHNWEAIDASQFIEENQPISRLALTARLSEPNKEHDLDHVLQFFSYGLHQYTDSLPLPKAIEMGFLRKYEYKIMPIVPDDKWIGAKPTTKNARIIWREFSETKKDISPDIAIRALDSKSRVLVYTGPKVDDASKTMKSMQKIWNSEQNLPMTIKKITGQESPTQRYNIINDFTLGLTQSLVAIKVLDEGVDLPVSDAAVMCKSNASYRQWIQRRGRILRKKVVSDNSKALVVDLVLDMQSLGEDLRQRIRELYTYEVKRTLEFANSSLTGPEDILDQLKLWGGLLETNQNISFQTKETYSQILKEKLDSNTNLANLSKEDLELLLSGLTKWFGTSPPETSKVIADLREIIEDDIDCSRLIGVDG